MRPSRFWLGSGGDVTDPVLILPTGTKTGSTTATGTVWATTTSTPIERGTLYYIASTASSLTNAAIIAGSSQDVTASGTQNVSLTGLSASTTYYLHYLFLDNQGRYSNAAVSSSFTTDGAGGTDNLLADDIESASEVSAPAAAEIHNLLVTSIESASEVTTPTVGQGHVLLSTSVESTSEVSSPVVGQVHALLANDVESASEVSTPTAAEAGHALLADDVESASEVSSPVLAEIHGLLATSVESTSEVGTPVLAEIHGLLATSVESASEVTTPTLTEAAHALLADDVESSSEVSAPVLAHIHVLSATSVESASSVSAPTIDGNVVGTLNIVHSFPTGQTDVTVALYDLNTGSSVTLDTNHASEIGSTGLYVWNVANITTYPGVYTEYGYTMTDGATTESGKVWAPDPLAIHLVNDTILN